MVAPMEPKPGIPGPDAGEESGRRRVRVIMFLDMAGFSSVMARSEGQAMEQVNALESLLRAEVPADGGRLVKFMGDGSMAVFPTATSAVQCARRILGRISELNAGRPAGERTQVRIGIHMGEVLVRDGDVFGDTVNIAARVQTTADPGELAMTEPVLAQVRNHIPLKGAHSRFTMLKNIPGFVHVFHVMPEGTSRIPWLARKKRRPAAGILAAAAAAVATALIWSALTAPPLTRLQPGDVIESWEVLDRPPLKWYAWDESVTAYADSRVRSEGHQGLRLTFEMYRYQWPMIGGSTNIGLDLRKAHGLAVDIYVPAALGKRIGLVMELGPWIPRGSDEHRMRKRAFSMSQIDLKSGWNRVSCDFNALKVPRRIRNGIFSITLMLCPAVGKPTGWVVFDNLRAI